MLTRNRLTKFIAAGVAAVALGIGGYSIANAPPATVASAAANPPAAAQPATAGSGQTPPGWKAGTGTIITGAAADKATAAAVAAYPQGTVNRVLQLSDGSYAVHRIGISSAHHIFVSKDFVVTGTS
jgi:hypothetical protein